MTAHDVWDRESAGGHRPPLQTQIGPRSRRSLIAAARNAVATANPIHRPGLLSNSRSVNGVIDSIDMPVETPLTEGPTTNQCCRMAAKCEVLKAIFSTAATARGGSTAHSKGV